MTFALCPLRPTLILTVILLFSSRSSVVARRDESNIFGGDPTKHQQQREVSWATDSLSNNFVKRHRLLQELCEPYISPTTGKVYNCTLPPPDKLCENINNALDGAADCTCARFAQRQVEMKCIDTQQICNNEKTWCAVGSFETVIDEDGRYRYGLSCTNITSLGEDQDEDGDGISTCVQVIPVENGNFSTLEKCAATLNGEKCSCEVCTDDEHLARHTENPSSSISVSVNCCNIQDGAIATCTPVGPEGRTLVQFDALPAPDAVGTDGKRAEANVDPIGAAAAKECARAAAAAGRQTSSAEACGATAEVKLFMTASLLFIFLFGFAEQ